MGAQITAYILLGFISPNVIYRRKFAQAALGDFLNGYQTLFNLLPNSDMGLSWLFERDGKAPSYKAWYLFSLPSGGWFSSIRHDLLENSDGLRVMSHNAYKAWVFKPSSEYSGLVNMVAFHPDLRRRVYAWNARGSNQFGMVDADSVRGKSLVMHIKVDINDNGTLEISDESDRQLAPSKPVALVILWAHIPNKESIFLGRHLMVEVDMKKEFQI